MPKAPKKLKPVLTGRASGSAAPSSTKRQQSPRQQQSAAAGTKHKRPPAAPAPAPAASKPSQHHNSWSGWRCASVIDQQSAEVVGKLLLAAETRRGGATIKSLTLAPHIVHKKPTFAVTCETLKHLPLLKLLLADVGLVGTQDEQQQLSPAAAYVLSYELLFGQGFRQKGPAEKAVLRQRDNLQSALQRHLAAAGAQDAATWLQQQQPQQQQQQQPVVQHPRYARVNTLRASVQQVLAQLQAAGAGRSSSSVAVDSLLPDLLVFPPGTDLHDHPLVNDGVLILQGKSSCMPAHALQPGPGWHVVDCCAAPGNKTTHVAALLHAASAAADGTLGSSKGSSKRKRSQQDDAPGQAAAAGAGQGLTGGSSIRVYAFDKDPKRVKRLAANVDKAGAGGIVVAQRADFLSVDPQDPQYAQVRGVILDPSCSGSGTTVSRMDHLLPTSSTAAAAAGGGEGDDGGGTGPDEQEMQRVEQLAKFQEAALLHALQFPALHRLVYSTCSIHQRENEDVVAAVLPAAAAAGFCLVDPFPAWHRRGLPGSVEGAEKLVRTDAQQDGTDGFFVAVFERSGASDDATGQQPPAGPSQQQQQPQQQKKKKKKSKQAAAS